MFTRFATFFAVTAIVLTSAGAQAHVSGSLDGRSDFSDSVSPLLINQSPSHDQCDTGLLSDPAFHSADPSHVQSPQDFFLGHVSPLDGMSSAYACDVPVPSPDPFGNVAMR